MKIKRVFVTGSKGFIGQHLCRHLLQIGDRVVGNDKHQNKFNVSNIHKVKSFPLAKIQAIVHLAAKTSITDSLNNPYETYYANVLGTLNLLEFARLRNIHKIINISTYVYGLPLYLPVDEGHPVNPHSPYNRSKLLAEDLCRNYSSDFGIDIVTLRPFNVYGPGSKSYTLISSLIQQIKINKKVTLTGKDVRRDLLHIEDFVNLLTLILDEFPSGYNVYNVGYGESHTLEQVIEIIAKLLKRKITIAYDNKGRPTDKMNITADTSKVTSSFRWCPVVDLEKGLSKTVLSS